MTSENRMAPQKLRPIGLIVVGDEILSGKRQDKHFSQVIGMLKERGLMLTWVRYLGDDRDGLTGALKDSMATDDLVFCCGGIGSTPDDHTRQAAAAAAGQSLRLHPIAEQRIAARCEQMASEGVGSADMSTPENQQRLKMGEFPAEAAVIENPYNGIPGFSVGHHHFVPGFPVMAWPMIAAVLDQDYADLFGQNRSDERSFWVVGLPESAAAPVLEQIQGEFDGIGVFSLPSARPGNARRHIELGVKGDPAMIEEAFARLRSGIAALGTDILDSRPD